SACSLEGRGSDGAGCLVQNVLGFLASDMVMLVRCRLRAFTTGKNRQINRRFVGASESGGVRAGFPAQNREFPPQNPRPSPHASNNGPASRPTPCGADNRSCIRTSALAREP